MHSESRSDDYPFLFVFLRRNDDRYIIYKIDALSIYYQLPAVPDSQLLPLLVFRHGVLPDCSCAFAYIRPYFYIIGEKKNHVFTVNKDDLVKLTPSKNARGAHYVSPMTSHMSSDKSSPLAFAYQNNLYVISKSPTTLPKYKINFNEFEVYSPQTNSWTSLGSKPLRDCHVHSHVVIGTMVYFTTSTHVVMSFSLERAHWGTIYDPYGVTYLHKNISPNSFKYVATPTFDQQILVIQNIILGSIHTHGESCFRFSASPSKPSAKFFLRPPLNVEKPCVSNAISCCSCTLDNKVSPPCSSHVVAMDESGEMMCGVCYSTVDISGGRDYVGLTFFKVPAGVTSDSIKFESVYSTRFLIKTKEPTRGVISTCLFV